jgi:pyruvate/2-oxoglutarate dehydrogenase complex dihydrolipoamide dehydrogenase (E3) component
VNRFDVIMVGMGPGGEVCAGQLPDASRRVAGVARPTLDWEQLRDYHDYMVRHLDDSAQVEGYQRSGATVVKGTVRLSGRGNGEVDGKHLEADGAKVHTGRIAASARPSDNHTVVALDDGTEIPDDAHRNSPESLIEIP